LNGSFVAPALTWQDVNTTVNGSFINSVSWQDVNTSINGTFSHIPTWYDVNTSINGSFVNAISWYDINTSINGAFVNTISWSDINTSINGSFTNSISWQDVNTTINGTFSHIPTWYDVNTSINGTFTNTLGWSDINTSINGTFTNSISWQDINTSMNGSFVAPALSWQDVNTSINGTFSHVPTWYDIDTSINGLFVNAISWSDINTSINGSFINSVSWQDINTTVNGAFINTISWQDVNTSINGSFYHLSSWIILNSSINGSFVNIISWQDVNTSINGSFYNPLNITNISTTPASATQGTSFNISCHIYNVSNLTIVRINFTNTYLNMDEGINGTWYYNDTFNVIGTYRYHIYAKDENSYSDESSIYIFRVLSTSQGTGGIVEIIDVTPPSVEIAINEESFFVVQINNITTGEPATGMTDYIYCYIYYPNGTLLLNGTHPYEYTAGVYIQNFSADVIGDYVVYATLDYGYTYLDAGMFSIRWDKYDNYTIMVERIDRLSVSGQIERQNQTAIIKSHLSDQDKMLDDMQETIEKTDMQKSLQDIALDSLFQTFFMILIFIILLAVGFYVWGQRKTKRLIKKMSPQEIAEEIILPKNIIRRRKR